MVLSMFKSGPVTSQDLYFVAVPVVFSNPERDVFFIGFCSVDYLIRPFCFRDKGFIPQFPQNAVNVNAFGPFTITAKSSHSLFRGVP